MKNFNNLACVALEIIERSGTQIWQYKVAHTQAWRIQEREAHHTHYAV